jgi:hypothetical protein
MRQQVEERLGFGIEQLQIREQLQLLNYLGEKKEDDFNKAIGFIKAGQNIEAQIARAKVFFALESGFDLEGFFEVLNNNLLPAQADLLFLKFAEILGLGYAYEHEISRILGNSVELDTQKHERIRSGILAEAIELLRRMQGLLSAQGQVSFEAVMLNMLENYHQNILLSGEIFKAHHKREGLTFEELENISFVVRDIGEYANLPGLKEAFMDIMQRDETGGYIFKTDRIKEFDLDTTTLSALHEVLNMVRLYYDNYADKPQLQQKLVDAFISELFDTSSRSGRLYMYKEADAGIMTFAKMLDQDDGGIYAGGFNVNPIVQAGGIGTSFLDKVLMIENQSGKITAETLVGTFHGPFYVERFGFVITGFSHNYDGDGTAIMHLARHEQLGAGLRGIDMGELRQLLDKCYPDTDFAHVFGSGSELQQSEDVEQWLGEGYVISRLVQIGGGKLVAGFEKTR